MATEIAEPAQEKTGQVKQVPFTCTPEVAKAICDELSLGGIVKNDPEFIATIAAHWQRNRILEELRLRLNTKKALKKEIDDHPCPALGSVKAFLRGGAETEIALLESLIAILQ